jgi:FG-GAP repeat
MPILSTPTGSPRATSQPGTEMWSQEAGSFTPKAGSDFGFSISLSATTFAVGSPSTLGNGAAFIYLKQNGIWETDASGQLFGDVSGGHFGASVAVTDRFLIVGAPLVFANGTSTASGAAYCFILNNGSWDSLGQPLRGDTGIFGADELFGFSVASSTNGRVVVGAPGSSVDLEMKRGRVYVFEYSQASTTWSLMQDEIGAVAGAELGSAVDMTSDGTRFLVGSPGGTGQVELYEFDGSAWQSSFTAKGEAGEGFGTAVALGSTSGDVIVIGAPDYLSGQGRVLVYQRNGGTFSLVGPSIIGGSGERFGSAKMVSGDNLTSLTVAIGTSEGFVKHYVYDQVSDIWTESSVISSGFGSNLLAVASASSTKEIAVGGLADASIYQSA